MVGKNVSFVAMLLCSSLLPCTRRQVKTAMRCSRGLGNASRGSKKLRV